MERDVGSTLLPQLQRHNGSVLDFAVLGVLAGGACAFQMLHNVLLPAGLTPNSMICIMSQPACKPNVHVERTHDATVENITSILGYYSILCDTDLSELNEGPHTGS